VYFLVDAQLPRSFCDVLRVGGHQASHVTDLLSAAASDLDIINLAKRLKAVVVTKDADFAQLVRYEKDVQIVWLRVGNVSKQALVQWYETVRARVEQSLLNGDWLVEIR
jgi:predicted nuclease of predicted toxin-antitoxin system